MKKSSTPRGALSTRAEQTPNWDSTDLYSILGLTPQATYDQIKAAYRKLAKQHHPDQGGDGSVFAKLGKAYETLIDPRSRLIYDRSGIIQDGQYWADVNRLAGEKLEELLNGLLNNIHNLDTVDVMSILRDQVRRGPHQLDVNEAATKAQITKIKKLKSRFKPRKEGASPLVMRFFDRQIQPLEQTLKSIQLMRDVNEQVGKLIEGWDYVWDPTPTESSSSASRPMRYDSTTLDSIRKNYRF